MQQLGNCPSARVDQVLAVVENDEQLAAAQLRYQGVDRSVTRRQFESQRLCHLLDDQVTVGQRGKLDQDCAVAIALVMSASQLYGQRRLAGTARSRQRH